jgi:hypothetical protein
MDIQAVQLRFGGDLFFVAAVGETALADVQDEVLAHPHADVVLAPQWPLGPLGCRYNGAQQLLGCLQQLLAFASALFCQKRIAADYQTLISCPDLSDHPDLMQR